jgi:hypothetical protein
MLMKNFKVLAVGEKPNKLLKKHMCSQMPRNIVALVE